MVLRVAELPRRVNVNLIELTLNHGLFVVRAARSLAGAFPTPEGSISMEAMRESRSFQSAPSRMK